MTDPPGASVVDETAATAAESTDAIVVRLGTGKFAVELASVAEVGRTPEVTRVPGLPAWLAGVANWRGRILPILNLRPLLGAETTTIAGKGRLLVLTGGAVVVGVLVDAVDGTTSLGDLAPFPAVSAVGSPTLLSGQLPREDGPIALLDVAAVLALRDALPRGRRSA